MVTKKSLVFSTFLFLSLFIFLYEIQGLQPARIMDLTGKSFVYRASGSSWDPITRGELIHKNDRVRTTGVGFIDFRLSSTLALTLERNSKIKMQGPSFMAKDNHHQVDLFNGSILVATEDSFGRKGKLTILTPFSEITVKKAVFRVHSNIQMGMDQVYVLEGLVEVRRRDGKTQDDQKIVPRLQKITVRRKIISKLSEMDEKEWRRAYGAYRIRPVSHDFQKKQLVLSRKAGSFFKHVIEHGDFYTPRHGLFRREFYDDPRDEKVFLRLSYDVFTKQSFVGFYMKTEELLMSQFSGLQFDMKPLGKRKPDVMYLELKYKNEVKASFSIMGIDLDWKRYTVDFDSASFDGDVVVDEMVLYLTHATAGEEKQGTLFMRDVELIRNK